jgi:DNA-binding MarR family transcriptional regulator
MKKDELHTLAHEIRILMGMVMKLVRQDLDKRLQSRKAGIGALQLGVLRLLAHESQTISEMSRKMMLEPATLVPVIDALERKGLAQRGRDLNDRRRTPVSPTEKGAALVESVPAVESEDTFVKSLGEMGDDKCRQLLALLRELAGYMMGDQGLADEMRDIMRQQMTRRRPNS